MSDDTQEDVHYTIRVFRDKDGRFAAEWLSGDEMEAGMGNYSATAIGALAELVAVLIKVEEDKSMERRG